MTLIKRYISKVGLSILMLSLWGCHVNYSFTGASIPIQAKTFTVKPFVNMAPTVNPTLAHTMTDGLHEKIMSATSLVSNSFDADMAFEGIITGYNLRPVALQGGETTVAAKNRLTITIKVKFENRYEPKLNYDTNFTQYAEFDSNMDFSAIEQSLAEEIADKLTEDIFN
ncbi:MAG: LptE family protein [Salinivirgaceae bacterium]|nr:LptE family protein [Salinivirgaceae bacterium]